MDSLLSLLGGGVGVALVSGIFLAIQNSMAQKSAERLSSKKMTEEKFDELVRKVDVVVASGIVVLHDRIKYLARSHIIVGRNGGFRSSEYERILQRRNTETLV